MPISGRVSWADLETHNVYGSTSLAATVSITTAGASPGGRGFVSWAEMEVGAAGGSTGASSSSLALSLTSAGKVTARGAVSLPLTLDFTARFPSAHRIAAAGFVFAFGDLDAAPFAIHGQSILDGGFSATTTGKVEARGSVVLDLTLAAQSGGRSDSVHGSASLPLSIGIVTGPRLVSGYLALYESLLAADRPLAWWGLDSARPTYDDSGHGRTLTAVGMPAASYSLLSRGDDGVYSGSVDFDGASEAYVASGTVYQDPVGPPQFHAGVAAAGNTEVISVVSPASVEAGDLLIAVLVHPTATATIVTSPSGWTLVGNRDASSCAFSVWTRSPVADEPPTEWTWTWSSTGATLGAIFVYRNCDPAVSGLVYASTLGFTASGSLHQTTSVAHPLQSHQLAFWMAETPATISADPTGMTSRADLSVGNVRLVAAEYAEEAAGSSAPTASTSAATVLGYCVLTFGAPQEVVDETLDVLSETITLHAICRPTTLVASDTLIRKHGSWGVETSGTTLRFVFTDGDGAEQAVDGPEISADASHHLVVSDDGTNVNFWLDGVKTSVSRPGAAGYTVNSNPVVLGAHYSGSSYDTFLDGRLDEVAVWDRPLSDEMVEAYWEAYSEGTFGQLLQGSAHYPRAKLEVAWGSAPTDDCLVWTDVTDDLRSAEPVSATRGRNFELDRFEPGRLDFTLTNRDRQYDPTVNASVVPTRAVRLRAQAGTDGRVYGIFFGYTEGHPLLYPALGYDATARFTAIDPFKALALDQVLGSFVRPQELSGARLAALLDGFPGIPFTGEAGQSEIVADDLAGVNSLDHAQQVAESEGGILFCDGSGVVTFQDRHHRSQQTEIAATYGDGGFTLRDMQPVIDESRLFTSASVTPASGNVKSALDVVQASEHFLRTKQVTTLQASDADAQAMAEAYAHRYATPRMRVPSIDILPTDSGEWEAVLSHEISDRIKTAITPVGGATSIEREHFVEGVKHTIGRSAWVVSFSVSPAELEGEYWVLGRGALGQSSGLTSTRLGW